MIKFNTLFKGDWISIVSPVEYPYEAVHEKDIIIVLPVLVKDGKELVGIRSEFCPPYFLKDENVRRYYTVISGKIEPGENPEATAVRELQEESGVCALTFTLHPVASNMPICKSTDMRAWIYVMNILEYKRVPITGDGTENEKLSKTIWVSKQNLCKFDKVDNKDFLLTAMLKFL